MIAVLVRTAVYINSEEDAGDVYEGAGEDGGEDGGDVYEGAGDVEETTKSIDLPH